MKSMFLIAILLASTASYAAGKRAPSSKARLGVASCMRLTDTTEIFSCLDTTYSAEDQKLNDVYATLTTLLKSKEPKRYDMVRAAELAWIKLCEADCKFDASADDAGDASGAAEKICLIRETMARRSNLQFKFEELQRHIRENAE